MNDNLARFRELQRPINLGNIQTDTTSDLIAQNAQSIAQKNAEIAAYLESVKKANESQPSNSNTAVDGTTEASYDLSEPMVAGGSAQGSILPGRAPVTQTFGQNSKYDVFSGNKNWGVDFGIKEGTPLAVPPGEWKVIQAFGGAKGKGYIGDKTNSGYGNSILVMNPKTGETLRFSHLNGINVQPGQVVKGGTVIGASGGTGNATNPHLDLEYRNASGKLADVLNSPYSKYLFGGT
jgi:murein DD-endopeptidase MepM/ murein hydrolase activator NlpD